MQKTNIKSVAILGAGNMGAQLAAQVVNAGLKCILFDLKSDISSNPNSSIINATENLIKLQPPALASEKLVEFIIPANLTDNLDLLLNTDLIIEAVSEDYNIKQSLYKKITPYLNPNVILATNSSGLSVNKLVSVLPKKLKANFIGMHFFNPPRYLPLVELIKTKYLVNNNLVDICEGFLTNTLGKSVVYANDTANFIANRLAIAFWFATVHYADIYNIPLEVVDQLTGKALSRPKSATCRTADLVGLDIIKDVLNNNINLKNKDPLAKILNLKNITIPVWLEELLNKGYLGQKTQHKKGIYWKQGDVLKVWDIEKSKYIQDALQKRP